VVAAALAAVWGGLRVGRIDERLLHTGHVSGVATVISPTGPGRAVAHLTPPGEDVLLDAGNARLQVGEVVRVTGTAQQLFPEVRDYYAHLGVHLGVNASDVVPLGYRGGPWGAVDTVHRSALNHLGWEPGASPERALVAGVALGEGEALPADVKDEFRASGLSHIVAASGQNIALVVVFTLVVLGVCGVVGAPARFAALGLTALYVLLAGGSPSIVRAGVAGGLTTVGWLASRPLHRWHLVACGAVAVLWVNPLALFDPGFQLSFAAVVAIHLVAPRVHGMFSQAVAISAACTLATLPIAWWHFSRLAPLSIPANLLALPAVAPILWLGLGASLAGAVWQPLATPLLALADVLAGYVLWVARLCS
jgi:competence protein ComEC